MQSDATEHQRHLTSDALVGTTPRVASQLEDPRLEGCVGVEMGHEVVKPRSNLGRVYSGFCAEGDSGWVERQRVQF